MAHSKIANFSPGLVRFAPKGDAKAVLIGQPVDSDVDVGAAIRKGEEVKVKVFSGSSVLDPGSATDRVETIDRVLSPLSMEEVGTIRCIGLNVRNFDYLPFTLRGQKKEGLPRRKGEDKGGGLMTD